MTESNKNDRKAIASPIISQRRRRISWVWLVPFVAALVGLSLLVHGWMNTGPTITISFESAEGLEVGQTKVRYKDVIIGRVTGIKVAPGRDRVLVKAELDPAGASYFTREGTRFWVVRPRLAVTGISGLNTLLSGPYISVDALNDVKDGSMVYEFKGLEKPPEITTDRAGRRYTLVTSDLGSIEVGAPVYYRRIPVGRVIGYELDADGRNVHVHIFIDAPNDEYVTSDARFWNVSGIDVSLGTSGVSVKTSSLAAIIAGGVAFASINPYNDVPVPAETVFTLSDSEDQAMAEPDGPPFRVDMIFHQSVRGLMLGAPVDFRGMELGKVYDIDLEFDSKARRFYVLVKAHLYPLRFGSAYERLVDAESHLEYPGNALLGPMIQHGLRAQLQSANLLTGQQFIALNFFPDAEEVEYDGKAIPIEIPTIRGDFDRLQAQISSIVTKLDAVPFDGISKELEGSLSEMRKLLKTLDSNVAPQAGATLKAAQVSLENVGKMLAQDSPMNANLERTLRELNSAAKSLRALGDYLQTHPSALIRGRPADVLPNTR